MYTIVTKFEDNRADDLVSLITYVGGRFNSASFKSKDGARLDEQPATNLEQAVIKVEQLELHRHLIFNFLAPEELIASHLA